MSEFIVNLWQGELHGLEKERQTYWQLLSSAEKDYADTMHNDVVRDRFVEVRGRMRLTLGRWVNKSPKTLKIMKNNNGKPYLADYPEFSFNISHTGSFVVIVTGQNCLLGVDIEQCKPRSNLIGLVNKCFAEAEKKHWLRLPEFERLPEFYRFWTRKEAFVKATGQGIKLGLNQCVVNPKTMSAFTAIPETYGKADAWRIHALNMDWSIQGALVYKNLTLNPAEFKLLTYALPEC